jgi:hypothetical protein
MDVHVDEAGRDNETIGLNDGQGAIGTGCRFGNQAVLDDKVGNFIAAGGGIDNSSAANEKRRGLIFGEWA